MPDRSPPVSGGDTGQLTRRRRSDDLPHCSSATTAASLRSIKDGRKTEANVCFPVWTTESCHSACGQTRPSDRPDADVRIGG